MNGCKLSPIGLGLALGILWGISILSVGIIGHFYAYAHPFITAVGTVYTGYGPTIVGSIVGGIIGLVNGFITGVIIAWLYNCFSCCKCCSREVVEVKEIKIK